MDVYTVLGRNEVSGINIWGERSFLDYNKAEEYRDKLRKEKDYCKENDWQEYYIECTELVQ